MKIEFSTVCDLSLEVKINNFHLFYDDERGRSEIESDYDIYITPGDNSPARILLNKNSFNSIYDSLEDDVNDKILEYLKEAETEEILTKSA
jgi:DNA-dependent RNA polymerase auxiliary subunit epsilon